MHRVCFRLAITLACLPCAPQSRAQQPTVTYEKDAAGVTYQVTRRPVAIPQQPAAYPQQVMVPVTEYRLESHLEGWWNPFVEPTWRHQWVPVTRWEARPAAVQAPAGSNVAAVAPYGSLPAGGIAFSSQPARPMNAPAAQQQVAAKTSLAPAAGGQRLDAEPQRLGAAAGAATDERYRR